jgi:uncharacterized protein YjbJ (UPF0337 family)
MDKFKKDALDTEMAGKGQNLKGKIKEGTGRVLDREDLIVEGEADQAEGKVKEGVGKVGRNIADLADRAEDKLTGKD